jgi:hypothetical protein
VLSRLTREFGVGSWRKLKGRSDNPLDTGEVVEAELPWYEAHGIGKRPMKIKRFLEYRT